MTALQFSSLSSIQQSQVTSIFRDDIFGNDPADYVYEIEAGIGQLSGQRCQAKLFEKKNTHAKPRSPLFLATNGKLQLTDQAAHFFASLILPDLMTVSTLTQAPALADLPVAGPSL